MGSTDQIQKGRLLECMSTFIVLYRVYDVSFLIQLNTSFQKPLKISPKGRSWKLKTVSWSWLSRSTMDESKLFTYDEEPHIEWKWPHCHPCQCGHAEWQICVQARSFGDRIIVIYSKASQRKDQSAVCLYFSFGWVFPDTSCPVVFSVQNPWTHFPVISRPSFYLC